MRRVHICDIEQIGERINLHSLHLHVSDPRGVASKLMIFGCELSVRRNQKNRGGLCPFCFVVLSWDLHGCCIMAVHFADTRSHTWTRE